MNFVEFYEDVAYVYADELDSKHIDDAYKMAKKYNIGVLSDKEIHTVAITNNEVVGALWTSWMSGEFSFDIVVREDYQGQGVGKRLIDIAINTYNEDKEAFDNPIMKAYVVNKKVMVPMLLKKGFKVEKEYPDQIIMFKEGKIIKEDEVLEINEYPIYLNASSIEIHKILRDSSGVRIGVVSPNEIYYWDADYLVHLRVSQELHQKFELSLTYDKEKNKFGDYTAEDDNYAYKDTYPEGRKELIKRIKSTLLSLFPGAKFPDYMK